MLRKKESVTEYLGINILIVTERKFNRNLKYKVQYFLPVKLSI